jgi:homoserine acetyltransferase
MPSTVSRVRPLATTALVMPDAAAFRLAARYSVREDSSSCEKMWASG